jgi:hypothetical protein
MLLIFASCAPLRNDNFMIGWVGLPVAELRTHPYFSNLPTRIIQRSAIKKTLEYREPDGYRTKVECEQIGGCVGLQYLADCVYEFEVETQLIVGASLHGKCKHDERLKPQ